VLQFGPLGSIPVVGDWLGTGHLGIGAFDPSTGTWFLRNDMTPGPADEVFQFGPVGGTPVVGDWQGTGPLGVGVPAPATRPWHLHNELRPGRAAVGQFAFGPVGGVPAIGAFPTEPLPSARSSPASALGEDPLANPLARQP